jgi:hypothetical protein
MPLPTGEWTGSSNGNQAQLTIVAVDADGRLRGELFIAAVGPPFEVQGFWDEGSQKLTFITVSEDAYTGFLFQDQFRMPGLTGSVVYTLSGYFESFSTGEGSADRPVFGWYAQIGVP